MHFFCGHEGLRVGQTMPCATLETRVPRGPLQPFHLLANASENRHGLPTVKHALVNPAADAG
jgi:hypothetical protein